jgi:hypothetical protein
MQLSSLYGWGADRMKRYQKNAKKLPYSIPNLQIENSRQVNLKVFNRKGLFNNPQFKVNFFGRKYSGKKSFINNRFNIYN